MVSSFLALAVAVVAASDTTRWTVYNHGRVAGELREVRAGDSVTVRWRYQDRQRGPRSEVRYVLGGDGMPVSIAVHPLTLRGEPAATPVEEARLGRDSVRWTVAGRSGAVATRDGVYRHRNATPWETARLAAWLLRQPGGRGVVLPEGTHAQATVVADTVVTSAAGARRAVRLVLLDSLGFGPTALWLDERGALFTEASGWFHPVPPGFEGALPALRARELAEEARRATALTQRLAPRAAPALVVRDGDVFDSETGRVRPRTTIVIEGDRITQLGDFASLRIPAGARIIDARGRAIVPGMYDMHAHIAIFGSAAPHMMLAAGITTARDMAGDFDATLALRARLDSATTVGPRLILAGFLEGPGAWAGPSEVLVRTEDEARAWVARYDSLGYRQVKLYNLVHPDLVPVIVEEAHRRGMRVSGHIPRGMSLQAAIGLGFDEVQHLAFLVSNFFPDSMYLPRMRAYSNLAGDVLGDFDVEGAPLGALIAEMRRRGTVYDPTLNVYAGDDCRLPDGTHQVFGRAIAWFPPRDPRDAPPAPCSDTTFAGLRTAKYSRMVKRMHDAGITIVPGTDNVPGLSFHGELELYQRAGIPAAEVLRLASIVPAQVMKEADRHGSIAVGKVADLLIVDGRPWEDVRALRWGRTVIRAGRDYPVDALWRAAGITRRADPAVRPAR